MSAPEQDAQGEAPAATPPRRPRSLNPGSPRALDEGPSASVDEYLRGRSARIRTT
ncbi:hypothetical protein QJS66_22940 [Kocuria rhizophila]|nr:hypothetical protein QJS66_22940 [Kocuria rhizophila]